MPYNDPQATLKVACGFFVLCFENTIFVTTNKASILKFSAMRKIFFLLAVLMATIAGLQAQTNELTKAIPVDPTVKIGRLDNGLTYYIRQNNMPENRVEMRLVTNAGSILEDDDQQGLAHFVEHMCFNGTKTFSKSALIDFLESSGVRFGADLNAYTSFDETVYMLQLPTDRQGLIDSAFMVLEDWAHQVSFEDEEIDKERGVIREEWRLGLGAEDRMRKAYFPTIFKNSRYADRLPIGQIEVIDTAHYERLKTFYKDWYRPNLQAVIVVGDIDIQMAEEKIISHFAHIKNPANPKPRATYDVPGNKEPLVAITTDPEATRSMLMMFYKHPKSETKTIGDYKKQLIAQLYSGMIIGRLTELSQNPEAPFTYAYTYYGGFMGRAVDAYASYAAPKENQIEQTLEAIVRENERVRRYGFTPTELERQKTQILTSLEKQAAEKDKTKSSSFVREYTNHFLENEPIPGIANELSIARDLLPQITLTAVNEKAQQWITRENLVVVVTAPSKEGVAVPDEQTILETIERAKSSDVEAYVDSFRDEELVTSALKGSKVLESSTNEKLGITTITLSNNIKIVLKPTTFKNDEILMNGFGLGGSSLFEDDKAFAASQISRVADVSGLGNFSKIDLDKKLTGKVVSLNPFVESLRQGVRGSASPKDFETLLQLTYLHFNKARRDQQAFEAFKSQMINQFKFMRSNPQMVFYDTLYKLATQNSPRLTVIPSEGQLNALNAEEIYSMYDKLFTSAKDYTFTFVGNIDMETMLPLMEKYLGSLPVAGEAKQWIDRDPEFPAGITDAEVQAGTEPKSSVAILMENPFEWTNQNRVEMSILMKILSIKLRENMREEQGGVYGVGARLNDEQYPKPNYTLMVTWGTNPDLVDTLTKAVFYEMNQIKLEGPTAEDMAKARETAIRERETNEKENRYWNNLIDFALFNKMDLKTQEEFNAEIQAVTPDMIKAGANKYFTTDHYLRVVLNPAEQ